MNSIKKLYNKYKFVFWYLVFGGFTTLINIAVYWLSYDILGISNSVSNIIAWVLSVIFAFVTNKLIVFESKDLTAKTVLAEAVKFCGCRIATGLLDLLIMYVAVDVLHLNALLMKVISNIIVIILNYVASKVFIFIKK